MRPIHCIIVLWPITTQKINKYVYICIYHIRYIVMILVPYLSKSTMIQYDNYVYHIVSDSMISYHA
jgi:hypothetical protein